VSAHAWRTLQRRWLVDDRWLRLSADQAQLPDGRVLDPYYVSHDRDWVHVFALDAGRQVLLVRQYRYAAGAMCLELPGGVAEPGETPLAAAQRELLEETGCTASHWEHVAALWPNPARQVNRLHGFVARDAVQVRPPRLDEGEDLHSLLMPLPHLEQAIADGEFSQAMHVGLVYASLRHLGLLPALR
jgi:8-oxo-dGTP pyrophosphatase MutT (NUDIX family)